MHARMAEPLSSQDDNLTHRIRDVAADVGLLMVAATFILLGGAGLVSHLLGVAYPLSGLMVADAALAGFLAGLCLLGWLFPSHRLRYLAGVPLAAMALYTLMHNAWAGGPWQGASWVTGGPRILSVAALLLGLVALCCMLGMGRRWRRLLWVASGGLALLAGCLSLAMMLMPASRAGWASGFVSAPMLATLHALLGGAALVSAAWRGPRRMLPLGRLTQAGAVAGVMASCLAWYALTWSAQNAIQQQASTLLDNVELNARRVMTAQLEWMQRLAWRQDQGGAMPTDSLWDHDVDAYFRHAPYLDALAVMGPEGEVDGLRTSSRLDGPDLTWELLQPEVRDWLAIEWDAPGLMRSLEAPGKLLLAVPMDAQNRQLVARLDLNDLLQQELGVHLNHFRLTISTTRPLIDLRQPGHLASDDARRPIPHLGTRQVGLPGGARLTLDVYLDSRQALLRAGLMPGAFAISGLILSYLLALSLGLVRLVMGRSRELLAARQRLEAQYDLEQRFRSLYLYHPDGVFSVDRDGVIVTANDACREITGRPNEEVLGSHFSALLRPREAQRMQALFTGTLAGQPASVEFELEHRDGRPRSIDLTALPIIVEEVTEGVFGIIKDVTRQREQEAQIAFQASHDLLTGLANRAVLDQRLDDAFRRAGQLGHLMALMHINLDGFKAVNDGLGYHVGNQLLIAVADRLRQMALPGVTLARITADEFCLLLPELESPEAGSRVAEAILQALGRPYRIDGMPLHVSSSIGIASNTPDVRHAQALLQRADLALSRAKRQGRNTWQWYQGTGHRQTEQDVLLRHDLYTALQEEQFVLHYQPIVEAVSGRISGYEALVRWQHPQRGMVSPGHFIPLAEQTGQIIPLGRWVLRQACRDAATLLASRPGPFVVAVNISSLQFRRAGFLEDVRRALAESGLPPEYLELEVTESILLDGEGQAIDLINQIRGMGVGAALDDFGTGFSSLSYLRDLPIHKVKLDRTFIQDIAKNARNDAIVQGVITMAHHMEMVVVAEGIETTEQREDMIRRGCDLLQGFHFARPMPLEALGSLSRFPPDETPPSP